MGAAHYRHVNQDILVFRRFPEEMFSGAARESMDRLRRVMEKAPGSQ